MTEKKLLQVLRGVRTETPPIWMMRQAGRYLPEYRELRRQTESFLDFCYTPALAVEAALQPLRRYDLSAAILFSDILVVPDALGQRVWFEEGAGPKLDPVERSDPLAGLGLDNYHRHLAGVYEAVSRLRAELPADVALIGFAGAPWTVAAYMAEGGSSRDYADVRGWAYVDPEKFQALIDLLVEATASYLIRQADAGAEVLQLFDSWAGLLSEAQFRRWSVDPARRIVEAVKADHPHVPVIGFPRGAGALHADYAGGTGIDAVSLDASVPLGWAAEHLQSRTVIQGNLDNLLLAAGGGALDEGVRRIVKAFAGGPHIFNLGHGIVPATPPEHVGRVVDLVTGA